MRIEGISHFPYTEALSGLNKVRPRTKRVRHSAAAGQRTGWWGVYMSLSSRGSIVVVWGCGR